MLVLAIGAVIVSVVDLVDPDFGTVHAVEPVDWVSGGVVLLLVRTVVAVIFSVVDVVERYLIAVSADEGGTTIRSGDFFYSPFVRVRYVLDQSAEEPFHRLHCL